MGFDIADLSLQLRVQTNERRLGGVGGAIEISLKLPSDIAVLGEVVELLSDRCRKHGVPYATTRFRLKVVLCEAIQNAMLYGNKLDPGKSVQVTALIEGSDVTICVEDEGRGFDPDTIPDPTTPERLELENGRGLFVIRNLVDELRFNDRGNCIWMVLRRR